MKTEDALIYFKNMTSLAEYFNISKQAVQKWGESIPEEHAKVLQEEIDLKSIYPYPFLKKHGKQLVRQGHRVIPIPQGGKFPKGLKNWNTLKSDSEQIDRWLETKAFSDAGVGVITCNTPAIDIDVHSKSVVDMLVSWSEEHIGATVQRVGESPKTLLVFRAETPFSKLSSHIYKDSRGKDNKIEILGDGQQFVAYAIHPDTKRPYKWVSEQTLVDVEWKNLPLLTVEKAKQFIQYFETIRPSSYRLKTRISGSSKEKVNSSISEDEKWLMNYKSPKDVSTEEIQEQLVQISADDRTEWIRIGMSIYHQYDGNAAGFQLWDEWSRNSDKYDSNVMEYHWKTFKIEGFDSDCVTISSIFFMAKMAVSPAKGFAWKKLLKRTDRGKLLPSRKNLKLIIKNSEETKNTFVYNEFDEQVNLIRPIFHFVIDNNSCLNDLQTVAVAQFLSDTYDLEISKNLIGEIIMNIASEKTINPVKDYLNSVEWDSVPRLDTVFIDYLGEGDDLYTREASRKFFVAGVARIFKPGTKFDYTPIISGKQGLKKSLFVKTLAVNPNWFGENLHTFKGKEAVEATMKRWIIEIAELQGFSKSEIDQIKAFFTQTDDTIRLPYDRFPKKILRSWVAIGTTNDVEYLKDDTGNRRFWPLVCNVKSIDIKKLKENINQIWAEASVLYQRGEKLYLSDEAEKIATSRQEDAEVDNGQRGSLEAWLEQMVTSSRYNPSSNFEDTESQEFRTRVCVLEVWEEFYEESKSSLTKARSRQIANLINSIGGWCRAKNSIRFGNKYGKQKGFIRKDRNGFY